jgi:hypothetical protein
MTLDRFERPGFDAATTEMAWRPTPWVESRWHQPNATREPSLEEGSKNGLNLLTQSPRSVGFARHLREPSSNLFIARPRVRAREDRSRWGLGVVCTGYAYRRECRHEHRYPYRYPNPRTSCGV